MPTPSFRLVGLPSEPFEPLFELSDAELARLNARRVVATEKPGFPCRIGLADAEVGDELLLLPFQHQPADSPYQASGPIFVRRGARQRILDAEPLPPFLLQRLISLRAYDAAHQIVEADVCEGAAVSTAIERLFADPRVEYLHLHNARRGCYACRVVRA